MNNILTGGNMTKEFGYTAETQSEQRINSSQKNTEKFKDPRKKEIMRRALENTKLPRDVWNALIKDIQDGVGKKTICSKYGIKSGYFKYIKQIVGV